MRKLKYLVVGTGRCGTVYLARLLTSMGIACGHETIFDNRGMEGALSRLRGEEPLSLSTVSQTQFDGEHHQLLPDWLGSIDNIVAESSYMASPFLYHECLEGTKVIHVVRHPVKVINSFLNYMDYFQKPIPSSLHGMAWEYFIYNHLEDLKDESLTPEERAACYYVKWNRMIDEHLVGKPHIRVKAEDGPKDIAKFVDYKGPVGDVFDDRSVNTFRRPAKKFFFANLKEGPIKEELVTQSALYGYRLISEHLLI